jgi:hypothetical protein
MVATEMIEKQSEENQSLPSPVTPGLRVSLGRPAPDGSHGNGGARPNAGHPKGVPNKTESTDTPPPAAAAE